MNEKIRKPLIWAVVLSETSHVFCCVLPTIVSLAGLLTSAGMVIALPGFMIELHDFMHDWEVHMIVISGAILLLGWLAVWHSERIDCHHSGCAHGACAPRKKRAHMVLKIATLLFIVNVIIYGFVHRSGWFEAHSPLIHAPEEQ